MRPLFPTLGLVAVLATPAFAQGSFVRNESGPSTLITNAPVYLVDGSGKRTKLDPMAVKPKSGSKFFGYSWSYALPGEPDATVAAPVRLDLGKVKAKEVTSGYSLVKVEKSGANRTWTMKQNSKGFYPADDCKVYDLDQAPAPKKNGDGSYSITLPAPLKAGSYLLMTASEGWEFEVR